MAGGLQFDPPVQFFRKADTGRISGSANGFLPRRSGPINGGTSYHKKKAVNVSIKKDLVKYMIIAYQVSRRRACKTLPMHRSGMYYKPHRRDQTLLAIRMREIAYSRIRYGYRRIEIMLKREGFTDNHKRVHRVYCELGLNLRTKRPRRNRSAQHRVERVELCRAQQVWSMDFVADQLFDGRKFRILTIVDNFAKKCPGLLAEEVNWCTCRR